MRKQDQGWNNGTELREIQNVNPGLGYDVIQVCVPPGHTGASGKVHAHVYDNPNSNVSSGLPLLEYSSGIFYAVEPSGGASVDLEILDTIALGDIGINSVNSRQVTLSNLSDEDVELEIQSASNELEITTASGISTQSDSFSEEW